MKDPHCAQNVLSCKVLETDPENGGHEDPSQGTLCNTPWDLQNARAGTRRHIR
jgi:hypothetical protein